jgi:uracil-DNA glycosylase
MSKNLIKKVKLNFLDFLKQFSSYLLNKKYPIDDFLKIIDKYEINRYTLIKRLLSYTYHNPHIIYYFNSYLNNKYESQHHDIKLMLENFKYIMHSNNINKLYFFKAKDFKDENKQKIKTILKEYYEFIENKYLNDLELNHLYLLFCKKIITIDEILKINKSLNNNEKIDINLDFLNNDIIEENNEININEYLNYSLTKSHSNSIFNFISEIKNIKLNSNKCKQCKLYQNNFIPFDTNCEEIEKLDVLFIGIHPDSESIVFNKILFNEGGKLLRQNIFKFNKKIKWGLTNIIPCCINNIQDIGKTDKQISTFLKNCNEIILNIIKRFSPKIIIPIGKHSMNFFNIKGSIIQNSGKISKINNLLLIPIINPSSIDKNEGNKSIYDKTWEILYQVTNKLYVQNIDNSNIEVQNLPKQNLINNNINNEVKNDGNIINKFNIDSSKIINLITENLTYFDCFNLDGNNILIIYIDENGEKFYKIEEYKIPIYIKNTEYNSCKLLESKDEFTYTSYINGFNKFKLNKSLKDNLLKFKYSSLN